MERLIVLANNQDWHNAVSDFVRGVDCTHVYSSEVFEEFVSKSQRFDTMIIKCADSDRSVKPDQPLLKFLRKLADQETLRPSKMILIGGSKLPTDIANKLVRSGVYVNVLSFSLTDFVDLLKTPVHMEAS